MKPTVLLVQFDDKEELLNIKKALIPFGIRIRTAGKEGYLRTIGELITGAEPSEDQAVYDGEVRCERMMVIGGCSNSGVDLVITVLRKQGVAKIPYKAILTETNQNWTCLELYSELRREHEQFQNM